MTAPRNQSVAVGGLTFHYVTWGPESAHTILLLHGLTSHARSRDALGRDLSMNRRVITLDHPEAFARAVRDFLEAWTRPRIAEEDT